MANNVISRHSRSLGQSWQRWMQKSSLGGGRHGWWLRRSRLELRSVLNLGALRESTVNTIMTHSAAPLHHAAAHPCSSRSPDVVQTPPSRRILNSDLNARASTSHAMSTNTKVGAPMGAPTVSTRVPERKGDVAGCSHAQAGAQGDGWRKDFVEKQADPGKQFDDVTAPPAATDEVWWTPDPMTGVFVPERYHGCVTTAPRESASTSKLQRLWETLLRKALQSKDSGGVASSSRMLQQQQQQRSESKCDHSQSPWFDNMEDLPDMERPRKK